VNDYPAAITAVNHVEPVPRRIRAFLAGEKVLDTTRAVYVWEWPYYPQYYIPVADVRGDLLVPEGRTQQSRRGRSGVHTLQAGRVRRPGAARLLTDSPVPGLAGTVRFDWAALDAWFEEDEQVFVHPRSPYVRVDALRSARPVRVELDGVVLAESPAPPAPAHRRTGGLLQRKGRPVPLRPAAPAAQDALLPAGRQPGHPMSAPVAPHRWSRRSRRASPHCPPCRATGTDQALNDPMNPCERK
jgi:uncharacterized protein (DUF427 family)